MNERNKVFDFIKLMFYTVKSTGKDRHMNTNKWTGLFGYC